MTLGVGDVRIPPAHALLVAGEAEAAVLFIAVARRIDELLIGQVLEVDSRMAGVQADAASWCRETGNELVALLVDHAVTRFWIRKGATADPACL